MKPVLISLGALLFFAASLQAELVVSRIEASGNVQSQSIAVLQGNDFTFYPAQLEKTSAGMTLSAEVPGVSEETLLAAVVVLADGRVISSPLRKAREAGIDLGSSALLQEQMTRLKAQINRQQERLQSLQQELEARNSQLRRQAGLEEVDAIYSQVKSLDQQIQALKAQ